MKCCIASRRMWCTSSNSSPVEAVPPKIFGACIRMISQPMPLIKPPITGVEMKLVKRPARSSANNRSHRVTIRVTTGTKSMASLVPPAIPKVASIPPTSAAGAASTPKTNCGEEEHNPKRRIGRTDPYKP